MRIVQEQLGRAGPAITLVLYTHPDQKMHKRAGMRQNRRVAAALAKAERDSRLARDKVKPLRRAAE